MEKLVVLASADWATLRLPKKGEPGLHLVAAAGPAVVEFPPIPMFTEAMTLSTAAFTEGRITECCRQKIHLVRSVEDQTFSQAECFLGRGHPNQRGQQITLSTRTILILSFLLVALLVGVLGAFGLQIK